MSLFKKALILILLLLFVTGTAFGFACSGTKDFDAQYEKIKETQTGSPETISSLSEIKTGTTLEIQNQEVKRKAESVPVVIKLKINPENRGKIHYALATKEKYFTAEDYGSVNLFNWVDGLGTNIVDGLKKGLIVEDCTEWKNKKDALAINLSNYSTQESTQEIDLYTATAVPQNTFLVILCAPAETKVKVYYFDGTKKTYNTGKGILNGGEQLMVPIGRYSSNAGYSYESGGEFTKKTVEQIKEKKACLEEGNGKELIKWNLSGMLEEILATSQNIPWSEQLEEKQGSNQGEKPPEETGGNTGQTEEVGEKLALKDVYFSPQHPTEQDTKYLKCIAEALIPEGNQKEITYHFTWKVDGKTFFEKSYTKPANTTGMYTQLEGKSLKAGQKYECSVTVSDGETTTEPKTAETTIEKEESIGNGKGEEPDKDGDGFPDSADKCPNQSAPESNDGCPTTPQKGKCADNTEEGKCSTNKPKYCSNGNLIDKCSVCDCPSGKHCNKSTEKCETDCKEEWICIENNTKKAHRLKDCSLTDKRTCAYGCENGQCKTKTGGTETCRPKTCSQMNWECGTGKENKCNTTINCGGCSNGTCQNHKCVTTQPVRNTKVQFVMFPVLWNGSQTSFESEADRQLAYFFQKAGLTNCKQNYEIIKVKKSDIQKTPACAALTKTRTITCLDDAGYSGTSYWENLHRCTSALYGSHVKTNTQNTALIALTDADLGIMQRTQTGVTCGIKSAAGIQTGINGVVTEYRTGKQVMSHEIGHIHRFCEQYSMQDWWNQNRAFGCTNYYAGLFGSDAYGPYEFYLRDPPRFKDKKCISSEKISCPNIFVISTLPKSWFTQGRFDERRIVSDGPYSICRNPIQDKQGNIYCQDGGIAFIGLDCFGRKILNSAGKQIGYDLMGFAGIKNLVSSINARKGVNLSSERYYDCFEKRKIQEDWGCGK